MSDTSTDERAAQRAAALREKEDFEALTANPGWKKLVAWMKEQERERTDHLILKPCTGVKDQLEAEYSKGEIASFRLIQRVVEVGIETATAVARSLEDDRRDSTADASSSFDDDLPSSGDGDSSDGAGDI